MKSELTLEIAWSCDLDCQFCRYRAPHGEAPESAHSPKDAVTALHADDSRILTLSGGEPTTLPDLPALVALARERSGQVWLATHGQAVTAKSAALLAAAGLFGAYVLSPHDRPDHYDRITRSQDGLRRVVAGIDALVDAGIAVVPTILVGGWNVDAAPRIVDRFARRWPAIERFRVIVPDFAGTLPVMRAQLLPWSVLAKVFARMVDIGRQRGVTVEAAPGTALPYCMMREAVLPQSFVKAHERRDVQGSTKAPSCAGCALTDVCRGVPEPYAARFGTAELAPVTAEEAPAFDAVTAPFRSHLKGKYDAELKAAEADVDRWTTFRRKTLVLRVNGRCNIRCVHCWVDFSRPDAAFDDMAAKVREAARNGVHEIAFSGGEPTMYDGLEALITLARDQGIPSIELQTNAMRCKDRSYAQLVREAGVTKAFTTLLGSNPETSKRAALTPKAFTETVAGLHNLCAVGVAATINYVINRVNLSDLEDFVRFFDREFHQRHDNISLNLCVAQPINDLAMDSEQWHRSLKKFADDAFPGDTPVPTIGELRAPLRAALDYLLERGIPFHGLNSLSGVPLCVLDGDERYFPRKHRWQGRHMDDIFTKLEPCATCDVERFCMGVRRNYLELHGAEGIQPVKQETAPRGYRRR